MTKGLLCKELVGTIKAHSGCRHGAELLPQFDVVAALAFIIEAVDASNGCTLLRFVLEGDSSKGLPSLLD